MVIVCVCLFSFSVPSQRSFTFTSRVALHRFPSYLRGRASRAKAIFEIALNCLACFFWRGYDVVLRDYFFVRFRYYWIPGGDESYGQPSPHLLSFLS